MTPANAATVMDLRRQLCEAINIESNGDGSYLVTMPFYYPDGDGLGLSLRVDRGQWLFSDGGETLMRLSWKLDLETLEEGQRFRFLRGALLGNGAENRHGELVVPVQGNDFSSACYRLLQAIMQVTDLRYLARDVVFSTFLEDFERVMSDIVPERRRQFHWSDPEFDPEKLYSIDCRVNGSTEAPLFIFALNSADRAREATITVNAYSQAHFHFAPVAVLDSEAPIPRRARGQLASVCRTILPELTGEHSSLAQVVRAYLQTGKPPVVVLPS